MKASGIEISQVKLKTVCRDIRVSGRSNAFTRLTMRLTGEIQRAGAINRFTQMISGRYLGRYFYGEKSAFVFQHAQAEATPVARTIQIRVMPRITLTLVTQPQSRPTKTQSPQPSGLATVSPGYRQDLHRPTTTIEPLVQRLIARERRIESVSQSRTHREGVAVVTTTDRIDRAAEVEESGWKAGVKSPVGPADRTATIFESPSPVPRVVRRTTLGEAEPERQRGTLQPAQVQAAVAAHSNSMTALLSAAPTIDLNRLTDQVIKAIDYRLLAQRERTGRV